MSTLTLDPRPAPAAEEAEAYRALHAGAIVGLLVSLLSLVFPLTVGTLDYAQYMLLLALLPLAALVLSWSARRAIRANRELYTGEKLATAGVLISALSLAAGVAYGGAVFATEVPDGYARTSFQELKPSIDDERAGRPVPDEVAAYMNEAQPVFIKGYIRPDSVQYKQGIKEFLLVRDNNTCCFGDMSKVAFYDQIMVTLLGDNAVDLESRLFRVGGELSCRPGNPAAGEPVLVYSLRADYVK